MASTVRLRSSSSSSTSSSSLTTAPLAQGWNRSYIGGISSGEPPKAQQNLWSSLVTKAKEAIMDDSVPAAGCSDPDRSRLKQLGHEVQSSQTKPTVEGRQRQGEAVPVFQKGFGVIASSLSSLGNAIEGGLNLVETKASGLMSSDSRLLSMKKKVETAVHRQRKGFVDETMSSTYETQLRASRDVSMAMATKAKLLIRELKSLKTELAFTRNQCTQLEEENKRLRRSVGDDIKPDEEDLVRIHLEKLLREKARLAQENEAWARENQFLREVVEYHQLMMQDVALLDEGVFELAAESRNSGLEEEKKRGGNNPPEKVISVIAK